MTDRDFESTHSSGRVEEAVEEAKSALGDIADRAIPKDKTIAGATKTKFQSRTFQGANYGYMPERYGDHDRALITLSFDDGAKTFIVTGKVSSGNPFEVGHAAGGGLDLRQQLSVAYLYDGQETIIELLPTGESNEYTGEFGRPEALLPAIEQRLGLNVGLETFA